MTDEPHGETERPEASAPEGIAPEVSRRVGSILDSVEREADLLREEAAEEARHYLEQSRIRADALVAERQRMIAELSDELIRKAEAVVSRLDDAAPVREGFENLVRALGNAAERLAVESERSRPAFEPGPFSAVPPPTPPPLPPIEPTAATDSPPPSPAAEATASAPAAEPVPAPATAPAPEPAASGEQPGPWADFDESRLIAIQMAATGSTRSQVAAHLRSASPATDADRMLDEIFGAGSEPDAKVPWATPG